MFNNILWNEHWWRGSICIAEPNPPGFACDHNVVNGWFSTGNGLARIDLSTWQALGYDRHSLVATPALLFVDAGGHNLRLNADSPALGAGIRRDDVPDDADGAPRPKGQTCDIGAYEGAPAQ